MQKTALVTGGAGGIGSAIVKKLCEDGFSVAVNYNKSEQRAKLLCSELVLSGYDAFPVKFDVSKPSEVKQGIEFIIQRNKSFDVLVNNSGISLWGLFDTVSDSQWNEVMGTNLTGAFNCCREVLPHMLRQKFGRIINMSSIWGQTGASCEAVYSASKAGIIGLTKALAKEYALSGITVNCVAPGVIDTEMMSRFSGEEKKELCEEIPMGRMGTPDEVAFAVSFFAKDEAAYITGQVLGVNGGSI